MIKNILIPCIIFLIPIIASAQTPCFNVDNTIGCTPFTVKAKNCAQAKLFIYYNFGVGVRFDSVFTFTKSGVYFVKQLIVKEIFDPNDTLYYNVSDPIKVTVYDAHPPKVNFTPCPNNKLRLEVTDTTSQHYTKYYIDYGDGGKDTIHKIGFVEHVFSDSLAKDIQITGVILPVNCGASTTIHYDGLFISLILPSIESFKITSTSKTDGQIEMRFLAQKFLNYELVVNGRPYDTLSMLSGNQTYVFKKLNTIDSIYHIQIKVLDACTSTSLNTDVYAVIPITVSLQQNQNVVGPLTYPEANLVAGYELYRNDILFKTFLQKDFPAYTDTDVKCAITYCYKVKTLMLSGTFMLTDQNCVKTISTAVPPVPKGVNSSILNEQVQLICSKPTTHTIKKFDVYKSENNGIFNPFVTTVSFPFIDILTNPGTTKYCYKISVTDSCDNVSPLSLETCPIQLLSSDASASSIKLQWSNYVGWEGTLLKEFTLQWIDDKGFVYRTQALNSLTDFEDNKEDTVSSLIRYRIMAEGNNDLFVTYSNIVDRKQAIKLFFPTAFTPNGDGINDVYLPKGRFVSNFKMYVYNRLDQLVFFTDDFLVGWSGNNAISGDYVIDVEASDTLGNTLKKKTIVTLIK